MPIFAGLRIGGVGGVKLGGSLGYGGVGGVSLSSSNNNMPTSSKNIYTEYSHILVENGESLIINTNDIQSIVYVYYYKCLNHPIKSRHVASGWSHPSIMKDKPSGFFPKEYCKIVRFPYYIRIYTSVNVIDIKYDELTYVTIKEFLKTCGYDLLPPINHEKPVFIEH
jgi:hypothetical protein